MSLIERVNARANELLEATRQDFETLGITSTTLPSGMEVLDFASDRIGTSAAGILLARICMADLADVSLSVSNDADLPTRVEVKTDHPLESCIGSQYAGWPLSVGDYFAMCSGPARSCRGKEPILEELGLKTVSKDVVAVLETQKLPDDSVANVVASECEVETADIQLCVARTASLPGTIQVVARSVETAMHILHELNFDLSCVQSGFGSAPLPPVAKNDLTALGWTNDAVLYGATVQLFVDCEDNQIKEIGPNVPSSSSSVFGDPFLDIFERFDRDFYRIDKMLFSPARVIFNNIRTGNTFAYGKLRTDVLLGSWGIEPCQ